jgi:hypothetical protein
VVALLLCFGLHVAVMNSNTLLQDSLRKAEQAVRADRDGQKEGALAHYEGVISMFLLLLQASDLTAPQKSQIRNTCHDYLDRAETLKKELKHKQQATPGVAEKKSVPVILQTSGGESNVDGELAAWSEVWQRMFLVDDDQLVYTILAKLESGTDVRRGRIFVSRSRVCFCPHVFGGKHAPPTLSSFAISEAVKLPLGSVAVSKEVGYMGLSSRVSLSTSGGVLLFRGLGDRRDTLFEVLERQREELARRQQPHQLGLVWPVVRALEERLDESWRGQPDEMLLQGLLDALRNGCEPGWASCDPPTLWALLLQVLAQVGPLLPTQLSCLCICCHCSFLLNLFLFLVRLLSSLLNPHLAPAAIVRRLDHLSAALLRGLVYLLASADGSQEVGLDARALAVLMAPALCGVEDAVAKQAVTDFVVLLVRERRVAF